MYKLQRKLLSQNFLYCRKLVAKLVDNSSISPQDLVLEIGPGKGIITEQLVKRTKKVIVVELDGNWYQYLKVKFHQTSNLNLYQQNFLNFLLPKKPYKVFANLPFSIEGKIIRKLINAPNPPQDCYLVVQKELAYRLSAPFKQNLFSITHKPYFDFGIDYHFRRTDYEPMTSVDTVLFRFTKKTQPLVPLEARAKYRVFIEFGFGQGLSVYRNLQKRFSKTQLESSFRLFKIKRETKPGYLPLNKWIELYKKLG